MINFSNVTPFGQTLTGETVSLITLKNEQLSCEVLTYGATIRSLVISDRHGVPTDIVLGYDTLADYTHQHGYLGATVGRFANRIAKGRFSLNGKEYFLAHNDGNNHLHGGHVGFSQRVWDIVQLQDNSVVLSLSSADGEEGYPGNLKATASYTLDGNTLLINYQAVSDKDTLCSLTNHSYFNLADHNGGNVLNQQVEVFADWYTPCDAENIPLGHFAPVDGTPMDLRTPTKIGQPFNSPLLQVSETQGYDHNYIVSGKPRSLRDAAHAYCEGTGISMRIGTTMPGLQFYTANYLVENSPGKGGCKYGSHHGFCFEAQQVPDAQTTQASLLQY